MTMTGPHECSYAHLDPRTPLGCLWTAGRLSVHNHAIKKKLFTRRSIKELSIDIYIEALNTTPRSSLLLRHSGVMIKGLCCILQSKWIYLAQDLSDHSKKFQRSLYSPGISGRDLALPKTKSRSRKRTFTAVAGLVEAKSVDYEEEPLSLELEATSSQRRSKAPQFTARLEDILLPESQIHRPEGNHEDDLNTLFPPMDDITTSFLDNYLPAAELPPAYNSEYPLVDPTNEPLLVDNPRQLLSDRHWPEEHGTHNFRCESPLNSAEVPSTRVTPNGRAFNARDVMQPLSSMIAGIEDATGWPIFDGMCDQLKDDAIIPFDEQYKFEALGSETKVPFGRKKRKSVVDRVTCIPRPTFSDWIGNPSDLVMTVGTCDEILARWGPLPAETKGHPYLTRFFRHFQQRPAEIRYIRHCQRHDVPENVEASRTMARTSAFDRNLPLPARLNSYAAEGGVPTQTPQRRQKDTIAREQVPWSKEVMGSMLTDRGDSSIRASATVGQHPPEERENVKKLLQRESPSTEHLTRRSHRDSYGPENYPMLSMALSRGEDFEDEIVERFRGIFENRDMTLEGYWPRQRVSRSLEKSTPVRSSRSSEGFYCRLSDPLSHSRRSSVGGWPSFAGEDVVGSSVGFPKGSAEKRIRSNPDDLDEETYESTSNLSQQSCSLTAWKYKKLIDSILPPPSPRALLQATGQGSVQSFPSEKIPFQRTCPPGRVHRLAAATAFYNLLLLTSQGELRLHQQEPLGNIWISQGGSPPAPLFHPPALFKGPKALCSSSAVESLRSGCFSLLPSEDEGEGNEPL